MKTLPEFINAAGYREAARIFECTQRCLESWKYRQRYPSAEKAQAIVRVTKDHKHGPVTFKGIYGE